VVAIYGAFAALTLAYHALPWWVVAPLGGYLVAWHGSLQHEVVHGHPTRSELVNEALVYPSLWLWIPFRIYRALHRQHHQTAALTDPDDDPESYYVSPAVWASMSRPRRAVLVVNNTSLGRLVLGPFLVAGSFLTSEAARVARGDTSRLGAWGHHALGVTIVLSWVVLACGIPLLEYLAFMVLPGISLTLLRSYAEHRADVDPAGRTALVETGPLLALLYLNNNLHVLHHRDPSAPWYSLPSLWRALDAGPRAVGGGDRYDGYARIIGRFAFHPREPVAHPQR
jgi:fatty acid desaturase